MANPIRINAATLNRPGVFVAQSTTGSLPQPIATHAVGYIFGTTPAEDYYGEDAVSVYSNLEPYKPTQISSVDDYLSRIGGEVPVGNKGALASYDGIKAFFDNVGVNGILYFTRVTPTPETVVDLTPSGAGTGFNAFAIKINGRYFGTSIGVLDPDGADIKVFTTTGLDEVDNARDIYTYLANNGDGFADYYKIEQSAEEAIAGKFRIFAKDSRTLPEIERFYAYQFSSSVYASQTDLLGIDGVVSLYTSVKEVNFRCVSRSTVTYANGGTPLTKREGILHLTGSQLSAFFALNKTDYAVEDLSDSTTSAEVLRDFLVDQGYYESVAETPTGKYIAVSEDLSSYTGADKWDKVGYWRIDTVGGFQLPVFMVTTIPTGNPVDRTGYLPDTVQTFYLNVGGENRAIIVNGATTEELATELSNQIKAILAEKEVEEFYDVEAVLTDTGRLSATSYVPNNGLEVTASTATAGDPYIRPTLDLLDPGATADEKAGANGFYSHDYVLRVKITSKNGISSPVYPGVDRSGLLDNNVVKLNSFDQNVSYDSYKVTATAKANDFVFAIERAVDSTVLSPGFMFAPEAYTVLSYEAGTGDFASAAEARQERLKVTQTLLKAAEGRIGTTEGITGTQHIALIDPGADETALNKVQDELDLIKSTVGVAYGHGAYYAPYIKNLDDRFVAPSGYVAGIACSRYINEGFQQPPAGARYPLRGAIGLRFDISAQQQEVTYALGLNPIRSLPNRGIVVWGSRTLAANPLFKFVNTRAILNVLIDVMSRSFDDILFEQIDSAGTVYARVKSIASQVCGQFYRQGALFGARPEQAYLVVCSSANNSNEDLERGTVRLDVYVATSPTLERLLITIVRTPAGQVAQLSDSFSRNEERFSALLNTANIF